MRDDAARPVRLADYTPSDFAVERSNWLSRSTWKTQRLSRKARCGVWAIMIARSYSTANGSNSGASRSMAPNSRRAPYAAEAERLILHTPPDRFTLEIETIIHPARTPRSKGFTFQPDGFARNANRKAFVNHLCARPSRQPVALYGTDRSQQGELPALAGQRRSD
ncbi:MAG: hypothetical protein WDN76_06660 [Alphaproteobacteria bacterium]